MNSPFCPSCRAVVFPGDQVCRKCQSPLGKSKSKEPCIAPRSDRVSSNFVIPQWSTDQLSANTIGSDSTKDERAAHPNSLIANDADSHALPPRLVEDEISERWLAYLTPPKEPVRIHALFQKVISNPIITETAGHREDAERIQFFPIWDNMEVNASAGWDQNENPPIPRVKFYGGLHVANRLLAAGVSAADLSREQTEWKFPLLEMLQQSLDSIRASMTRRTPINPPFAFGLLENFLPHVVALDGCIHRAEELAEMMDFCVLAHEVGHIVHRHGLNPKDLKTPDVRRNNEREADAKAYSILSPMLGQEYYFLGYLLSNLLFLARDTHPDKECDTHPARTERIRMLLEQKSASSGFENRFGVSLKDIQSLIGRYSSF